MMQEKVKALTGCKAWLINNAINTKTQGLNNTGSTNHGLYDAIVFKKFKALLGGKVRLMITGSAPISADVLNFLKVCFACPIIEGYGMTETCGGSVTTQVGDPLAGHVGGPLANVKIKLRSIPEMGYDA